MESIIFKISHKAQGAMNLVLAVAVYGLFVPVLSGAHAAQIYTQSRFILMENGVLKPVRSRSKTYSRGASLRKKMARQRKSLALKEAAKRKVQYTRPTRRRSLKGMKRAFVGSYASGSKAAFAPIFSRATLDSIRSAITRYEAIVRAGGWKRIPGQKGLKHGDVGERVALVKQRLMRSGDFPMARSVTNRFDETLDKAVKRFQERHGLKADGAVGGKTIRAMNVSAMQRLAQLKINLIRLETKLQKPLPARFVMVNIPEYKVEIVENNKVRARHNVVVGRSSRQTNIITAKITQTNFYPYWHVPQSIVVKDLLPRLRRGENVLAKMRMSVSHTWGGRPLDPARIDWSSPKAAALKFRQDPGVDNALGMLRINMPNRHAIYLHDTPTQNLLTQQARAFSSGCVRVKDVFKLANWLLEKNEGWGVKKIEATIRAGKPKTVTLKTPVKVYFDYLTAWALPDGKVQFRRDIYQRDYPWRQGRELS